MRIFGGILIVVGFLFCLSIVGMTIGIPLMLIGLVMVIVGGRKTIITNVVQVSNLPEQRYTPNPETAAYVPEVRQVGGRSAPLIGAIDVTPTRAMEPQAANSDDFDRKKWDALLKYDPEIAQVAGKLRQLGDHWVDELARSYLAINDKTYLPVIVQQIIADARKQEVR
jgi:hypothetical protein